jgi:hypothetical protein
VTGPAPAHALSRGPAVVLALIVAGAAAVRLLGTGWLLGAGLTPDFSFHPDDQRFIEAVRVIPDRPDLGGYVLGMVAQLYVVVAGLEWLGFRPNALLALRGISVGYALAMVWLVHALSMLWRPDRRAALLAAAFVALAPLHVLNSNFGTADVAAVTLFYATLACVGRYFRDDRELWFVLAAALTGLAMAVKFFLPLAGGLGLLLLLEPRGRRSARAVSAVFVATGAFAVASLFSYGPREFAALFRMLLFDNVVIKEARSPPENLFLYLWELLPALGLPVALLAGTVAARWLLRCSPQAMADLRGDLRQQGLAALRRLDRYAAIVLGMHGLLILLAGIHGSRHNLVFVPALCLMAGHGLSRWLASRSASSRTALACTLPVLAYLAWNAAGLQRLYRDDLRLEALGWVKDATARGFVVRSVSFYTPVRGTRYDVRHDLAGLRADEAVLTCDLEYARYLRSADAGDIFHPKGGQPRQDFYRAALLEGDAVEVRALALQRYWTVEQWLIAQGWLGPLQTFTPGACALLARPSGETLRAPPPDQAAARRALVELRPML